MARMHRIQGTVAGTGLLLLKCLYSVFSVYVNNIRIFPAYRMGIPPNKSRPELHYPADAFFVLGFETQDNSSTPVAKLVHPHLHMPIPHIST